ncbi:radical SAM protein [Candidatus Sumerlaeota bacterium]|nr:radical SAM protein [Candidatus Sumerlaeota bacterium]
MLYGWELITEDERNKIAEGIKKGKILAGPFHLALFPTDRCNLDCFFCYTENLRKKGEVLSWDALKKALCDGVSLGVKSLSLGGGGEPLIYPSLIPLLEFMEQNNLKMDSIKTNGTALTEKVADSLIRCGLRRITISLNDTRAEPYSKICNASPRLFNGALEGIRHIVEAKKKNGSSCEISVQVFVWRENYKRLPEMIQDLVPFGADLIYVNTIDGLSPQLKMSPEQKEEFKIILAHVIKVHARIIQFNLSAEGLHEYAVNLQYQVYPQAIDIPDLCLTPHRVEYCYMGWFAAVIEASGDVYPCCHFTTDKAKSLGNLNMQSLNEIWHGKRFEIFRREMRHLLLTRADKKSLPSNPRFIYHLCLERTACAFNYYLCSPDFYMELYEWSRKKGAAYIRNYKIKRFPRRILGKMKRLLKGASDSRK